jgi:hypothetical protein
MRAQRQASGATCDNTAAADEEVSRLLEAAPPKPEGGTEDGQGERFYGCLHYAAGVSFLALVACAAMMSREETLRTNRSRSSLSTAFVYLASSEAQDIRNLAYSLRHLDENYNARAGHRVVIVHDSIDHDTQTRLQTDCLSHLEFRNVSLALPATLFEQYNLSTLTPPHAVRGKWTRQNTCRFWFHVIAQKRSPLADVDIMIRLDTDSAFSLGAVDRDFVADFIGMKRRYGYTRVEKGCNKPHLGPAGGLKATAIQYVQMNRVRPKNTDLWGTVLRQKNTPCLSSFANDFEVLDLRFWRTHEGIRDWREVVERNGGIYTHRWGDGHLRFLTAALYVDPSEIVHISPTRLRYQHPHDLAAVSRRHRQGRKV